MPKKKDSPAEERSGDPACFEEALAELEEIVAEMDGDRVPLDALLKKYERGTRLLQLCQGHISEARARIEQIAQQAARGGVQLEPFYAGSGESTKTAGEPSRESKDPELPIPDDEIQLL